MPKLRGAYSEPDMLVGIVRSRADRQIFLEDEWYRVPVANWPRKGWEPRAVALFETKSVTREEQRVLYWGEIADIVRRTGAQLFPGKPRGGKEAKEYYQIRVRKVHSRRAPIPFSRDRRNPFIVTTRERFESASNANELILGSPPEERVWDALQRRNIPAEREWLAQDGRRRYWLDFALFCNDRNIDVEVDLSLIQSRRG